MDQPTITFVINGKTYSLRTNDAASIREIPSTDRRHLIALLEAVKRYDQTAQAVVHQAASRGATATRPTPPPINTAANPDIRHERLGSGDADDLMARLILEEKSQQKPGLTKGGIYKMVLGIAVLVILLISIF